MTSNFVLRVTIAVVLATLLSLKGYRKGSLSASGSLMAFIVGFATFTAGYVFGLLLLGFYYSGTKLTAIKAEWKSKRDAGFVKEGKRSATQVLACSWLGVAVAVTHWLYFDGPKPIQFNEANDYQWYQSFLICSYIAHYACCAGDTWASEIGICSSSPPRLITTLKAVPHGTNGGLSLLGTLASCAGGAFIGILYFFYSLYFIDPNTSMHVITLAATSGLYGSFIDSFLGATLQSTWYNQERKRIEHVPADFKGTDEISCIVGRNILTNAQVNLVSVFLTTGFGGVIGRFFF